METWIRFILAFMFIFNGLAALIFCIDFTWESFAKKELHKENNLLVSVILFVSGIGMLAVAIRALNDI